MDKIKFVMQIERNLLDSALVISYVPHKNIRRDTLANIRATLVATDLSYIDSTSSSGLKNERILKTETVLIWKA